MNLKFADFTKHFSFDIVQTKGDDFIKNHVLFETPISDKYAYKLEKIEKGEQIPIISDVMFNVMFNNESRKKYVSYLLSLVLEIPYESIVEKIKFIKNKIDQKNYYDSKKTVDLLCEIEGKYYNIEINNNGSISSLERNISYASDIYKIKMRIGEKYNYAYTIQININNFTFKGKEEVIEKYYLRNDKGEILTDKLTFYYIYLPKIREKYYTKGDKKLSSMEKMFLVFNGENKDNFKELLGGNKIMEEYVKEALDASCDEEVIGLYDRELHLEMLKNSEIYEAEQKGIKEGIKKGIKEGIKEGIEQGRTESLISVAKNLLKNNVSLETIISSTGLSKEQIENLK